MATRSTNNSNLSEWIFPIILLFLFPPAGIMFLILKLFTSPKKPVSASSRHPYYTQQERNAPLGVRTTTGVTEQTPSAKAQQEAVFLRTQEDRMAKLTNRSKRMMVLGGVLTAIFSLVVLSGLPETTYWLIHGHIDWFFEQLFGLLVPLSFAGVGGGFLWAGCRSRKQLQRFRRYLAMVGKQRSVEVADLAAATGRPISRVLDDLDDMLNHGFFPQGFLDYGSGRLVVSGNMTTGKAKKAEQPKAPEKKKKDEENSILDEIRSINDAIADEKLSEQIDRIGIITAKILEYQSSRPDKAPQLHSFLSYYLPTTLKILRAYAQLEAQNVSGENITSAMERIENMMDKVVEGFEKQLDMLFQDDAMDITTDVEVLERMLAKDGLSDENQMKMTL